MIRVVVAGSSSFGVPSFTALRGDSDVEIVGAVSQPERPVGRHQNLVSTAVSSWAKTEGLPCLTPKNWHDKKALNELQSWQPDCIVVAAYGVIVPPEFLAVPSVGCLNIHASLLPAYRGASPIAAAILDGKEKTGITFMRMDVGLDTGPILGQYTVDILPTDTSPTLTEKLSILASNHIVQTVKDWSAKKIIEKSQPEGATFAKKIRRDDGRARWTSAQGLERQLRAYTPWPGIWTTWHGKVFKIVHGKSTQDRSNEAPGTIIRLPEGSWGIVCSDGVFIPTEVQFEGKRPQDAARVPGSYPNWFGSILGT